MATVINRHFRQCFFFHAEPMSTAMMSLMDTYVFQKFLAYNTNSSIWRLLWNWSNDHLYYTITITGVLYKNADYHIFGVMLQHCKLLSWGQMYFQVDINQNSLRIAYDNKTKKNVTLDETSLRAEWWQVDGLKGGFFFISHIIIILCIFFS